MSATSARAIEGFFNASSNEAIIVNLDPVWQQWNHLKSNQPVIWECSEYPTLGFAPLRRGVLLRRLLDGVA
jgi:hypothetical protein